MKALEEFSRDPKARIRYLSQMVAQLDHNSQLLDAREEGKAEAKETMAKILELYKQKLNPIKIVQQLNIDASEVESTISLFKKFK